MAALFELAGLPEMQRRLEEIAATMLPLAGIALQQEADAILEASQPLVPIETGALKASGVVDDVMIQGTSVQTAVRYGGPGEGFERNPEEYAVFVHEDPTKHHPVGQAFFLQQPAFEAIQGMLERLAEAIRLGL